MTTTGCRYLELIFSIKAEYSGGSLLQLQEPEKPSVCYFCLNPIEKKAVFIEKNFGDGITGRIWAHSQCLFENQYFNVNLYIGDYK